MPGAALIAARLLLTAALLGIPVRRFTTAAPWPHPFRLRFLALHVVAAAVFSGVWILLNGLVTGLLHGRGYALGFAMLPYFVLGVWIYVMMAGVLYATAESERADRAEATAARAQLAALRAQLHPHFLFNALHTVVQLIPVEPRQAARAAEQLAALLRTTIEEDRDLVSLGEEWAFVQQYLDLERIRFGDRLVVRADVPDDARGVLVPSFALQTLVENAVRHGAAPREAPTEVSVAAAVDNGTLRITVRDTGVGTTLAQLSGTGATGLRRLRERLAALYDGRAHLEVEARDGVTASLVLPADPAE
jgi:LytS/YehU family sensor histidine kinase